MTLQEIKEALIRIDEVSLLELLQINSEDIVNRFEDFIEDRADELEEALSEDGQEES